MVVEGFIMKVSQDFEYEEILVEFFLDFLRWLPFEVPSIIAPSGHVVCCRSPMVYLVIEIRDSGF